MNWYKRMKLKELVDKAESTQEEMLILVSSLEDDEDISAVLAYLRHVVMGREKMAL